MTREAGRADRASGSGGNADHHHIEAVVLLVADFGGVVAEEAVGDLAFVGDRRQGAEV